MTRAFPLLLLFAAALNLTGCIGFRANELPTARFDSTAQPATQKVRVYSQWYAQHGHSSWDSSSATPSQHIQQRFDRALGESSCCTLVNKPELADVVLKGTAYSEPNPAAGIAGMISGFTFGAIPCWATTKVHLGATASNGADERTYDLRDSATMVIWLPLIVAMPFSENPIKAEAEIDANAYRTLIVRLQQDGLLQPRKGAAPTTPSTAFAP